MLIRLIVLGMILTTQSAFAFCGFFVAKADTKLFNEASKVVLVRDGQRTVITMANDFQGDAKDFAIVVPVPVVLKKEQVHVGDPKIIERLDAFSAPRLVEYNDPDPCHPMPEYKADTVRKSMAAGAPGSGGNALGVTIEAQFTVGEYDIVILSATESSGLETWLNQNGYKMPAGAAELLHPYIKSNTKFFVAKVNLAEYEKSGYRFLRPLQMAFESPKFMLPIRLGMANAQKEQDLFVYALSRIGRVEVTNYRTVDIPSNMDIPEYVKGEFPDFYKSMFQRSYEKEEMNATFVEYAWNMSWCDPCAADPLTPDELRKAGVFWLDESSNNSTFITRLHVRYKRDKFPEDLVFQSTPNQQTFQGRYVLRHPFTGQLTCSEGQRYKAGLPKRHEQEAQSLANLTGWDINSIRKKMGVIGKQSSEKQDSWWDKIFGDDN